jgi:hypothetical protein
MRIAKTVGIETIEVNKLQCVSKTVSCIDTLNDRDMAPLSQEKTPLKQLAYQYRY